MPDLGTLLWKLYARGTSRISVLECFQRDPYTYVKVVINVGEHDIVIQEITEYASSFRNHKLDAMREAMQSTLKKAADLITKQALAPVIKSLGGGSFYSGTWREL